MSNALSGLTGAIGLGGNLLGANAQNQGLSAAQGSISAGYGNAINGLQSLIPQFQNFNFQADPGYQFTKQQGELGINNAAASRGNYFAPSTLQDLSTFNTGLANQTYGNAFSRWIQQNQARLGLQSNIGNLQVGRGNNLAQNYVAQGQNASNMYTGGANIINQAINPPSQAGGGSNGLMQLLQLLQIPGLGG